MSGSAPPFLSLHLPGLARETKEVKFEDAYEVTKISTAAEQLLTALTNARKKANGLLLTLPTSASAATAATDNLDAASAYLALLVGLSKGPADAEAEAPAAATAEGTSDATPAATEEPKKEEEKKEEKKDEKKDEKKKGDKKEDEKKKPIPLNRGVAYSWSDFSRKAKSNTIGGTDTEIYSTLVNLGLYLLLLATQILVKATGKDADAQQKEAYKTFLQAAGVFVYLGDKIPETPGELSDLRTNVSKALAQLSLAEAQTITVARAEEGDHTPLLVSSLARDTSEKFQGAKDTLTSPNPTPSPDVSDEILAYLEYRKEQYLAKAYFHHGRHFANPEDTKAGKAMKAFQTAIDRYKAAQPFFTTFIDQLENPKQAAAKAFNAAQTKALDEGFQKMKKENDMVYYEKMPDDAEALPEPKSTLEVVEFKFPETDKKWTPEVYSALKAKVDALDEASKEKSRGCCSIM